MRQDLYTCTKCTLAANGQLSGFCGGCREACHADHLDSVFELYTKRDFRCDCGNTRAKNKCILQPNKDDLNVANEKCYGHNFVGKYCRCDRKYDYRIAMAQCAMCEDWFHETCYKTDASQRGVNPNPASLNLDYEFTCRDCVNALPVLAEYYENINAWINAWDRIKPGLARPGRDDVCTRPRNANLALKPGAIDFLWRPGFRLFLCRCRECRSLYEAARASYIVDRGDFLGAPAQEDLTVLNATDDAEIVNDVLDEAFLPDEGDAVEVARIPRKPLVAAPAGAASVGNVLSSQEIMSIRSRISSFLKESIDSNGGNINAESLRAYLSDLKADLMASFSEKLRS